MRARWLRRAEVVATQRGSPTEATELRTRGESESETGLRRGITTTTAAIYDYDGRDHDYDGRDHDYDGAIFGRDIPSTTGRQRI